MLPGISMNSLGKFKIVADICMKKTTLTNGMSSDFEMPKTYDMQLFGALNGFGCARLSPTQC